MAFTGKHLPDKFYQEGEQRISLRDHIFREVVTNILIHREYLNAFPAKLVIGRQQVVVENGNKPHGQGLINPLHFSPYPKNPILARFFKEIGWAEELGSGVRKLHKYSILYGGAQAELIEGDIFTINVPLTPEVTPEVRNRKILEFCRQPKSMTEIMEHTGLKDREHFRTVILKPLIDQDLLRLTIPDRPTSRLQKYVTAEDEPVNTK